MVELAFLEAIEGLLRNQASLVPAPKSIGVTEPADKGSLPAIVLALGSASRPGAGLGDRNRLMKGALPWSVTIDLANPTLPAIGGEPPVDLLSADRLQLTLPHGGLVKADGSEGPLESGDLSLTVDGQQQAVVTVAPEGGQVRAQPDIGLLEFGAALPPQGLVEATYRVGQWEQRIVFIKGTLRVDVLAVSGRRGSDFERRSRARRAIGGGDDRGLEPHRPDGVEQHWITRLADRESTRPGDAIFV